MREGECGFQRSDEKNLVVTTPSSLTYLHVLGHLSVLPLAPLHIRCMGLPLHMHLRVVHAVALRTPSASQCVTFVNWDHPTGPAAR